MNGNEHLHNAKLAKNDEFYTQLSDIENELRHYKQHFKGKIVLCNCDDPYESNFFKYFALHFKSLGLKKLIATGYVTSPIIGSELDVWTGEETEVKARTPYVAYINEMGDLNGDGRIDLEDVKILLKEKHNCRRKLHGDSQYPAGDFRSEECIKLLKQADIVVTNPPFSLFREYVAQLIEYDKKFVIMGNKNAITYKEFFPLLKEDKVWVGATSLNGGRWMIMPKGMEVKSKKTKVNEYGDTILNVAGVCWFTNLDIKKRHEDLVLYKRYNPLDYPKYDNYDAINVDKVTDIPIDYLPTDTGHTPPRMRQSVVAESWECQLPSSTSIAQSSSRLSATNIALKSKEDGDISTGRECMEEYLSEEKCNGIMGVPITFLDKYNPAQFEILGITDRQNTSGFRTHKYTVEEYKNANDLNARAVLKIKGVPKTVYARLLIKRR